MCRCVKIGVWGCVQEKMCAVPCLHSVFAPIHLTNPDSEASIIRKIKLSNGVLRSGNSAVAATCITLKVIAF